MYRGVDGTSRIVFLWPVPRTEPTAAARRLSGFEDAAHELGLTSIAIVPKRRNETRDGASAVSCLTLGVYDSHVARYGPAFAVAALPWSTLRLIRVLRTLRCSCVVASSPAPLTPLQAVIASKVLGCPSVFDVRDSWKMEEVTHRGRLRNRIKRGIEGATARSATRVFAVTRRLARDLEEQHGLTGGTIAVVPNGADFSEFGHPGDARDIDLIFLGSPAKYRNIYGVLESIVALRRLRPTLTAIFLGWGNAPGASLIRDRLRTLNLSTSVELVSVVPQGQVLPYLRRARLGIVSISNEEVFRAAVGAKTYEYLAAGVPLACLGPPGDSELRSLVGDNHVGFYASTPEEFAASANALLSDSQKWEHVVANCSAAARNFDRRTVAREALQHYVIPLLNSERD